ncbi:unnamed protein product [Brassica oleracea]
MIECEDNWNCQLEDITFTAMDAKVSQLEHIFIRGSKVRFMVIPDILKHAPMFKRLDARIKGKGGSLGVGRDRAAMRAGMLSYTVQLDIEIKIKGGPIRFRKAIGHLGILHPWFEIAGGDKKRGGGSLAPSAMAVQSERFVYLQQNKRSMDIAKARKKREKLGIYVPRLARVSVSVEGIALGALAP